MSSYFFKDPFASNSLISTIKEIIIGIDVNLVTQ